MFEAKLQKKTAGCTNTGGIIDICQCKRLHLLLQTDMCKLPFLLDIIVVNLNSKDDDTACCGDEVRDEQSPQRSRLMENTLKHKAGTANTHHEESWQCNTIGIMSTNGINRLRQITQDHRHTCQPTKDLKKNTLLHNQ